MTLRVFLVIAGLTTTAGLAAAQSLADVARAEAARRKTVPAPGKVYTNDDLKPDFTRPAPPAPPPQGGAAGAVHDAPPPEATSADAAPAGTRSPAGEVRDQAYWSGRLTEAQGKVARSQAFAQALQNRIDMLWTDFVNRGDPVQQRAIEQDRIKALAELDRVKKEIQDGEKEVAAIRDEARRAGVPAGWLRD